MSHELMETIVIGVAIVFWSIIFLPFILFSPPIRTMFLIVGGGFGLVLAPVTTTIVGIILFYLSIKFVKYANQKQMEAN